jgi:hypothetical protein
MPASPKTVTGNCRRGIPPGFDSNPQTDSDMKPLKMKSSASMRVRLGYAALFLLFAAAFI